MEPYWRQTDAAWLAFHPDHAQDLASPLAGEVPPSVRALCAHLLALGGFRVAVQFADKGPCDLIRKRGQLASPRLVVLRPGEPHRCHTNSAALWKQHPREYRLVTGFALSRGVWRRHTWLLDFDGQVVETTVAQEQYFGTVLDQESAESFCRAGAGG